MTTGIIEMKVKRETIKSLECFADIELMNQSIYLRLSFSDYYGIFILLLISYAFALIILFVENFFNNFFSIIH
jgi:hypothetical protein